MSASRTLHRSPISSCCFNFETSYNPYLLVGKLIFLQIHIHLYYEDFIDIINSIIDMDADVITIENSRSDEKLLSVFREGVKYGAGIGPGVYDIHSPRIPSAEEIADRVNKMLAVLDSKICGPTPTVVSRLVSTLR